MIMMTEDRNRQSDERLRLKTQNETLMREAMAGAGLTRWEARALPELVEEIYFSQGVAGPLRDGQILYQCTALDEGPGKSLAACRQVQVRLSVVDVAHDQPLRRAQGLSVMRQQALCRITEEAREQGGLLTQEDAAFLLHSSERTIRRDVAALLKRGIHVATRGFVKDIGPTLSHKGIAIQHWLAGSEPVEVARQINHSLGAVERYLGDFRRVAFATMKGFDVTTTARITRLSPSLITTYRTIYDAVAKDPDYAYRFDEIRLLDGIEEDPPPPDTSGKKGAPMIVTPCQSSSESPMKPAEVRS